MKRINSDQHIQIETGIFDESEIQPLNSTSDTKSAAPSSPTQFDDGREIFNYPCVALVNGMSGSRKGEKVIRILRSLGMTTFNLIELSADEHELNSLSAFLLQLFSQSMKEKRKVRVLICGGDGSIGWALSILDRALLDCKIAKFFEDNRSQLGLPMGAQLVDRPRRMVSPTLPSSQHSSTTKSFSFDESRWKHFAKVNQMAAEPFSPDTAFTRLTITVEEDATISLILTVEKVVDLNPEDSASNSEKEDPEENSPRRESTVSELDSSIVPGSPKDFEGSRLTKEEYDKLLFEKQVSSRHDLNLQFIQMSMLDAIYMSNVAPVVGVVPLGTGNDLSRCLGSGNNYPQSKNLSKFVNHFLQDDVTMTRLDRWHISFVDENGARKHRQASQLMCYFSVGYTAEISHGFQLARMMSPSKFDKRWKNKLQYIKTGTKTLFAQKQEAPLESYVTLIIDGKEAKLPSSAKSIAICNISSMGDGINFWGTTASTSKEFLDWTTPELGDGKLEVMSSSGLPQYLQMFLGLKRAFRIGQATHVSVILNESLPIDVDGEAWVESPGRIDFFLRNTVLAMVGPKEDLARGLSIVHT